MPLDTAGSGLTFQEERFSDLRPEIGTLLEMHALEADVHPEWSVKPDWDSYRAMDDSNVLCTITLRHFGELIGYASFVVWCHPHHRDMRMGHCNVLFLHPAHRKGLLGARLITVAEAALRRRGVVETIIECRTYNRTLNGSRGLRTLLQWLGYGMSGYIMNRSL